MKFTNLIAVTAILSTVGAASAEDLQKVAEIHEKAFIHGIKSKDVTWFQSVAAPDFYVQDPHGKKTSLKDSLAEFKQMFAMGNVTAASAKILKVTKIHNGMVVRVFSHSAMTMQSPGGKKPSKMVDDSTLEEKWTKDNGKWKIHSLRALSGKITIDGKVVSGGM